MSSIRMAVLALAASGLLAAAPSGRSLAAEPGAPVEVRTMYWNLYLGAPLEPVIQAALEAPETVPVAVAQAWAQVQANDFPARAKLIVDQLETAEPDIVGIGEAALWRLQDPGDSLAGNPKPARRAALDFLKVLKKEIRSRKLPYKCVVSATGTDIEMPGLVGEGLVDVRYTDRDAILVKRGTRASKKRSGIYETKLPLGFTDSLRTWTSVDAKKGSARFRFVATHLEDGYEPIQQGQAAELLAGPAFSDLPVILAGDFNSDPDREYAPAVHGQILAAGFSDAWNTVNPSDDGLTWGHAADLSNTVNEFTLRLDHVYLSEGVTATQAWLVGEDPADRSGGLWPSDHAGLVVVVTLP